MECPDILETNPHTKIYTPAKPTGINRVPKDSIVAAAAPGRGSIKGHIAFCAATHAGVSDSPSKVTVARAVIWKATKAVETLSPRDNPTAHGRIDNCLNSNELSKSPDNSQHS